MAITYDYKKFQEEHMGNFYTLTTRTDIFKTKVSSYKEFKVGSTFLPQNTLPKFPIPTRVITDDLLPNSYTEHDSQYKHTPPKKGPSMAIFKFTHQKPSALKIWTTLIDTPIHPREGYTEDQIRYRMFICLQLTDNFKITVSNCNNIIDADSYPLTTILILSCTLASCQESDFSDLDVLSRAFPDWVSSELYTPYYLTKQLCHKLDDYHLLKVLFDRESFLGTEQQHFSIDSGMYPGLTAYKLLQGNSPSADEALEYFIISYEKTPTPITDKQDIKSSMIFALLQAIEASDNFIIPDGTKITIPYFILDKGTSDAS